MADIVFERAIPILRIFDEAKAKEFYVDFLGFTVDWVHRFDTRAPLYMQVSRGNLVLHLSEHHGDGSPGANVSVWMTGLDEFHQDITSKNYGFMRPGIETTFYQARRVGVIDPFGNRIGFHQRLNETAPQT